jgi:hypothetical protein
VHFLRNVLARVPRGSAEMVAAAIRTIFAQPTGAEVIDQVDKVAAMLASKFPAVAAMLADAREDLTAFAAFPVAHWTKLWSTNPLERLNKELKRRTNVVCECWACGPGGPCARLRCWHRGMTHDVVGALDAALIPSRLLLVPASAWPTSLAC